MTDKAIAKNNQAVGLMGQFQYQQAYEIFTQLVKENPQWLDVQVNQAIALLNRQQEGDETAALAIVEKVLQINSDKVRADYVAGLLLLYLAKPAPALLHFKRVIMADPNDAYAAYYLAQCLAQQANYVEALHYYQQAIAKDPYLRSAYYGAFQTLQRLKQVEEAAKLVKIYQRLANNPRSHLAEFKYTRMGSKAEVFAIDATTPSPIALKNGPLFNEVQTVIIDDESSISWHNQANDSSPNLTVVDIQGDGLLDLFISKTHYHDKTINLILFAQPDGSYRPQIDHPLAIPTEINAAIWGDYDNDGLVDVYLCRQGKNQLWHQVKQGKWQDVTETTGTSNGNFDTVDARFFDADHDGDLDLFLVNANGPNELLNNNRDGSFRPLAKQRQLLGTGNGSGIIVPSDIDHDRDVDIMIINQILPHEVYFNDRLWSYHQAPGFESFKNTPALAALIADLDANGESEIYSLTANGQILRWQKDQTETYRPVTINQPTVEKDLSEAQLTIQDIDGNGVQDLIVITRTGWRAYTSNGNLLYQATMPENQFLSNLSILNSSPQTGPSIVALEQNKILLWTPGIGRHPFLTLTLSGKEDNAQSMRSNASGIGAILSIREGSHWSLLQSYRNHSATGQNQQPISIGLGGAQSADFVAINWTDGVFQSELNLQSAKTHHITETQRQLSSCPVLFAWNGKKYEFISDILGVGGIGFTLAPGEYAIPRPWENYLLPSNLLKAKNGNYQLKITEPMEENAYLDSVRLAVYDLPPDWQMVMDERMAIQPPQPTGEPRFYRHEILPELVTNERGEQVTPAILNHDGLAAKPGELDSRFIGRLKNEHILTLSFADTLQQRHGKPMLVIDGWVEYPYSQTIFAAWQAHAAFDAPTIEAYGADQRWHTLLKNFGYPAGMPRRMSVPLDNLPEGTTLLRLRTNLQIYWDRIAIAYVETPENIQHQVLYLNSAKLTKAGFALRSTDKQFRPDYDYQQRSPFWDTRYMAGYYTRLGDVDELLNKTDDAVAIIGPGEEVHLQFPVTNEQQPSGWTRYFVLETHGWAKDMDLFTRDGETVGPMPGSGKPVEEKNRLHAKYNIRYQAGY